MLTRTLFAFFVLSFVAVAQESEPVPPQTPGIPRTPVVSPLRGMNPSMLLRMRDQMTHELQQIQRQLGFIDPQDAQLQKTLKDMQAELLTQMKDINAQLTELGVPGLESTADPLRSTAVERPQIPSLPPGIDPTLIPGGSPQPSETLGPVPNVPRNPLPTGMTGGMPVPVVPSAPTIPSMEMMPPMPGVPVAPPRMPTEFDQDQAWADSPWAPRPSKELAELKQTVDGLRRELGEMRETVKALETQIQLLNRNFLLMSPQTAR